MTGDKLRELIGDRIASYNDRRIEEASYLLRAEKAVPVIGSGISVPFGLPTWDRMIQLMFLMRFHSLQRKRNTSGILNGKDDTLRYNEQMNYFAVSDAKLKDMYQDILGEKLIPPMYADPLECGEYFFLDAGKTQGCQFSLQVRQVMEAEIRTKKGYKGLTRGQSRKKLISELRREKREIEKSGDKISAFSQIAWMVQKLKLNVVNYNFDDLFELFFEAARWKKLSSIASASELRRFGQKGGKNIIHVHGRVRLFDDTGMPEKIILAENQYYHSERYFSSWMHALQAYFLHQKHLIFWGFSGQDYNFKSLLKNLDPADIQQSTPHYIFIVLDDAVKMCRRKTEEGEWKPESDLEEQRVLINGFMYYKEKYLTSKGILPIWTSIEELPHDLERIRGFCGV